MKENGMKEDMIIEQQLLEEQLQAVTGGCNTCLQEKKAARTELSESAWHEKQSLTATDVNMRNFHESWANIKLLRAMQRLNNVRQIQQQENHQ